MKSLGMPPSNGIVQSTSPKQIRIATCHQFHNKYQGDLTFVEDGKESKSTAVLVKKGPREIVIEGTTATGDASRHVFRKVADAKKGKKK